MCTIGSTYLQWPRVVYGDTMATQQEELMAEIAKVLDEALKEIYGVRMGFFLSTFRFDIPGMADYVSNANREQIIEALKETAKRFENAEIIPVTRGNA